MAGEIADVFMYLFMLADKLEIDLDGAVDAKLQKLKQRFGLE